MHTRMMSLVAVPFVAAALSLGVATPASAQGPVIVNIDPQIANLIALDLDVDVSQIPVTVQAPVGIAANVCNVQAAVLAQDIRQGDAECDAEATSTAFNRIVQRQLLVQ
jgi:hypothetical protein